MTIPATTRKAGPYSGTGAQTAWPFTFKVFAAGDIAVTIADSAGVETLLTLGSHYSVTLNVNQETSPGGTVTYPISGSPLPVGGRLTIVGDVDYDQPYDIPAGGNFSPLSLENQLDRTIMQVQQLRENVSRALQVRVTSGANTVLPSPAPFEVIGWDAAGTALVNIDPDDFLTIAGSSNFVTQTFSGTGAQTSFVISQDPGVIANLETFIGGVRQVPTTDYTISGTTLTFTSAPPAGTNNILVRWGQILGIGVPADGSVTSAKLAPELQSAVSLVYDPGQVVFVGSLAYGNGLRLLVDAGSNTGHFNTAVGIDALLSATTPYGNTAVGSGALKSTTTGYDNTAVGYEPLINNVDGYNNTGIAPKALYSNTSGYRNVAVGTTALFTNVSGFENVAIGVDALFASTGSGNTVGGYAAGSKVTTGAGNTAWGFKALGNAAATTTGNDNTAVGYRALFSLTSGLDNQAFGRDALVSLTTGNNNVAVGRDSLANVISGGSNVGVGVGALQLATSSNNVAVGTSSLDALTSGTNCTAVGHQAGTSATGNGQTLIGYQAGLNVSNGSNNTVLGASAGVTITSGGTNTLIGYTADGIAAGDNQTALGNGATCTASNQITLGNASVSALRCQVTTITALSDARDKADIQDLALGLGFINTVRPVRFTWATRDGAKVGIPEAGFIAQELRDAASAAGAEWVGLVDETNPDRLEATPGKLLPILIRAVQELSARVAELEARRD